MVADAVWVRVIVIVSCFGKMPAVTDFPSAEGLLRFGVCLLPYFVGFGAFVFLIYIALMAVASLSPLHVAIAAHDAGIEWAFPRKKDWCEWASFRKVTARKRYLVLRQPMLQVWLVPKRAFASPQEAEAFAHFAQERFAASRAA